MIEDVSSRVVAAKVEARNELQYRATQMEEISERMASAWCLLTINNCIIYIHKFLSFL